MTPEDLLAAIEQLNSPLGFDFTIAFPGCDEPIVFPGVAFRPVDDPTRLPAHFLLLSPGYDKEGRDCHFVRAVLIGPGDDTLWFETEDELHITCSWPAIKWATAAREWSDYVTEHHQKIAEADARLMCWAREMVAAGRV